MQRAAETTAPRSSAMPTSNIKNGPKVAKFLVG
jgi:hypothetical protein